MGGRNTISGRKPPPTPLPPPMPKPQPAPKPQPQPKPKPKPKPAPVQKAIRLDTMDDAQLTAFVGKAMRANIPPGFHDDITQRLILAAQWNDKPNVVPASQAEAAAKKRGSVVIYRTVNYNGRLRTSADKVADDFRSGDSFNTGGHGGQMYGGGAYFSSSLRGSKAYGSKYSGGAPHTIGGYLNAKANVVDMTDLYGTKGKNWIKQHPAAAKKLGFYKDSLGRIRSKHSMGSYTAMAMAMGYNVVKTKVRSNESYYTVLDRSVVTTSSKDYYSASKGMR